MSRINATAYSHVVIEVSDLDRAAAFYRDVLGAGDPVPWPEADCTALALGDGQCLVLAASAHPRSFADTGAHVAYRAAPPAVARIEERAAAAGIEIARYIEDRPEEVSQNRYLADPDGNRMQIVSGADTESAPVIDHVGVVVSDIEWADDFWVEGLGQQAVHRVGWATQDFLRAREWGEGKEDMAPGTRRWDQRYRDIPGGKPGQGRKVARPCPQLFIDLGGEVVLAIFLASKHFQEPPLETIRGRPRIGIRVEDGALDALARDLAAAGAQVEGPVAHDGGPFRRSVFVRERCSIFTEFSSIAEA
jgi:catechol 2,3-dioxygenase-like lactoylglutathione lyase family enzyme